MRAILEVMGAFLAVLGLMGLLWLLWGHQILPVGSRELTLILPLSGTAWELEQTAAGLTWLRESGLLRGSIFFWDRGLTPEGRAVAETLIRREAGFFQWTEGPEEWLACDEEEEQEK